MSKHATRRTGAEEGAELRLPAGPPAQGRVRGRDTAELHHFFQQAQMITASLDALARPLHRSHCFGAASDKALKVFALHTTVQRLGQVPYALMRQLAGLSALHGTVHRLDQVP